MEWSFICFEIFPSKTPHAGINTPWSWGGGGAGLCFYTSSNCRVESIHNTITRLNAATQPWSICSSLVWGDKQNHKWFSPLADLPPRRRRRLPALWWTRRSPVKECRAAALPSNRTWPIFFYFFFVFLSFFLFGGDRALVFLARTHVTRPTWLCRRVCAGFLNVASPVSHSRMVHTPSGGPAAVLILGLHFLAALSPMILVITSWCKVSHPRLWCALCSALMSISCTQICIKYNSLVVTCLQNPLPKKAPLYLRVPAVPSWDASGDAGNGKLRLAIVG